MRKAVIVIGGQYGDEGKGLITSYYCEKFKDHNPIVVRFSGSAQAGHTVVYNGIRHVFSHFGSGTLQNVPTYLAKEFVCHPMLFRKEREKLIEKGIKPIVVAVDPECEITTPFDMYFNQYIEESRGFARHGSCGVGFGCTIDRIESGISFKVSDGLNTAKAKEILSSIVNYYTVLGNKINLENRPNYLSALRDISIDKFLEDLDYFYTHTYYKNSIFTLENYTPILEGSQGLLLDPRYGQFPHVTRKPVGASVAYSIIDSLPEDYVVSVNYLTRPYVTRHGNGPLPEENPTIRQVFNIEDETNVYNKFQGNVRYAPFHIDNFEDNVLKDYLTIATRNKFTKLCMVMTCVDQIVNNSWLIEDINSKFDIISKGPSFSNVTELR